MQQGRRLFRKDLRPCFYSEVPVKLWLTTFFCWLVMASACMASPIHVRDFSSVIEVEGNGNVVITERLNVEIPHEGRFHGIYRDIPVISRWREQGAARIEILRVLLDGAERPPNDVEHRNGMVRVYQRDTEAVLAPGRHEFVLTYRMTGQIGMFGDNDELTWNVTGRGWESPVDEASCTVLCPEGAPFYGQKAWLGRPGSMAAEVEMSRGVRNNRQIMEFRTKRPVFPGEEFTVAAGWGKGFVLPERSTGRPEFATELLAALAGGLFLYFLVVWRLFGRDPEKGVVARFHAPQTKRGRPEGPAGPMSPAAVGYLFHKARITPECFGAALLSLAGRGCCRIEGRAGEGFMLKKGTGRSPYGEEMSLLGSMEEELPVDAAHGEHLYGMRRAMGERLRRDYAGLWKGSGGGGPAGVFGSVWTFLGMVIAVLGIAAVVGRITGGVLPGGALAGLAALLFASFFLRELLRLAVRQWRKGRHGAGLAALLFGGGMVLLCSGGILLASSRDILQYFTPLQMGFMLLTLLIPFVFSFFMDAPTAEARALLDEIEGLALYIGTAEQDRLNALNPPELSLQHYQELLPYAVALGLEDAWGARFSSVLAAQALAQPDTVGPALAGALSSDADRSIAAYQSERSSASSSSFGEGGGGAGSGGGGGGGGGC